MARDFAIAANPPRDNGSRHTLGEPAREKKNYYHSYFVLRRVSQLIWPLAGICTLLIGLVPQAMRDPEHRASSTSSPKSRAKCRHSMDFGGALSVLLGLVEQLFSVPSPKMRACKHSICSSHPSGGGEERTKRFLSIHQGLLTGSSFGPSIRRQALSWKCV
ncbi:hypothetical protein HDV62DRAFT_83124 [Trichoderma sp. SZMC 28011]